MTLGNFTATVRIEKVQLSGRFHPKGKTHVFGEMKLVGKLNTFPDNDVNERIIKRAKTAVGVSIEFVYKLEDATTAPDQYLDEDNESKNGESPDYIGTIHLRDYQGQVITNEDAEIVVNVYLIQPVEMISYLLHMGNNFFIIDTINDIISNPTEDEKLDNVVAFIKRAYFQTIDNLHDKPKRKKRWFDR